jgi:hypothetical protein
LDFLEFQTLLLWFVEFNLSGRYFFHSLQIFSVVINNEEMKDLYLTVCLPTVEGLPGIEPPRKYNAELFLMLVKQRLYY